MVMRKFFTALVLIPLGLIFHHLRGRQSPSGDGAFDPFNSADPSVAVTLPLFVVIIAVAIAGVVAGGTGDLVPAAPLAPRRAAAQADARQRGRNWRICARRAAASRYDPRRLPAPAQGGPIRVRRARQAGRDVVEPAPSAAYILSCCCRRTRALKAMSLIVKICGLSTRETLDVALQAGADMVGFVFFPPSPRHISLETARDSVNRPKARDKSGAHGRCRRCDARQYRRGAAAGHPAAARQGNRARLRDIKQTFGLPVMKVLAVEGAVDLAPLRALPPSPIASCSTPRAEGGHAPGGLGAVFDWHLLENLDLSCRSWFRRPHCRNVAEAISRHPRGGGRCFLRLSSGRRAQGFRNDPRFHSRRARHRRVDGLDEFKLAQFIPAAPTKPGISAFSRPLVRGTLMPLISIWEGVRCRQGRSGIPGRNETATSSICRPGRRRCIRERLDRASRRPRKSTSSARS